MAAVRKRLLMVVSPLLFLAVPFRCTVPGSMDIPVGAILDKGDDVARKAFEYAVMQHRQDLRRKPFFRFNVTMDTIDVSDTFQVASAICRQMSSGVFAILGQTSTSTTDIVRAFTSVFHMPFLTPSPIVAGDPQPPSYELHVRPDKTSAIVAMIRYFGWRHVHYLYDSDEGLHRLQQLFRALGNDSRLRFFVNRFSDLSNVHEELRAVDAVVSSLPFKSIVLDLSSNAAYSQVLRQIPEVGMNKKGYSYLLTTMEQS